MSDHVTKAQTKVPSQNPKAQTSFTKTRPSLHLHLHLVLLQHGLLEGLAAEMGHPTCPRQIALCPHNKPHQRSQHAQHAGYTRLARLPAICMPNRSLVCCFSLPTDDDLPQPYRNTKSFPITYLSPPPIARLIAPYRPDSRGSRDKVGRAAPTLPINRLVSPKHRSCHLPPQRDPKNAA